MYFVDLLFYYIYLPKEGVFDPFGWNRSQIPAAVMLEDS